MNKWTILYFLLTPSIYLPTACAQIVGNRLDELPIRVFVPEVRTAQLGASDLSYLKTNIELAIDTFTADQLRMFSQAQAFDSVFLPAGRLGHRGGKLQTEAIPKEMEAAVAAGPVSLPHLLKLLRDQTPTDIVIDQSVMNNSTLSFAVKSAYFSANDASPGEFEFFCSRMWFHNDSATQPSMVNEYIVRRCDVALILLGQITNRRYDLMHREAPKAEAFVVGCGGDEGEEYRNALLEFWQSDNPSQRLFESLVADFYTRPVFDFQLTSNLEQGLGEQRFHRNDPMDLQIGALVRLLKYFPREAEDLVVCRIDGFRESSEGDFLNDVNGVRVADFIVECLNANSRRINDALSRLKSRTNDRDLITVFDRFESERGGR